MVVLGLVLISLLAIRIKTHNNAQSNRVNIIQQKVPGAVYKIAAREAFELKKRGYLLVKKGTIIDNKNIEKILPHISLNKLTRNTTFSIIEPSWLPKGAKLVGRFPGGPTNDGPWEIVSLLYNSSEGEFRLGEAQPRNTNEIKYVYPKALINDEINGARAIHIAYVEKNTGRRWNSIAWHHRSIEFLLQGELSIKTLKKIAVSIH